MFTISKNNLAKIFPEGKFKFVEVVGMKHNSEICEICWRLQPKDIFGRSQGEKYILRCLEDSVLLDKARAATALNLAVPDVIAILKKHTPRAEINKSGRIMGEVRKVAKIPMGVLSKDTILHVCLTSVESDDEVEETRVKETTFPEIEDNDTPVTKQDYFDMGDLPLPPPPLPSLNESISNDFPPPPFIEMMGNMTVDMGTPLEEGPQADEPLPSPPRLPLETFVPLVGRKGEEASFGFAAMHASSGTIGVVQGFPYRRTRPSEEIPGTANIATEFHYLSTHIKVKLKEIMELEEGDKSGLLSPPGYYMSVKNCRNEKLMATLEDGYDSLYSPII
uniref:Uncharacterized protein n=1 Tax=Magallana gigas TaxID=29159 RepID=K1REH5_MAGGI